MPWLLTSPGHQQPWYWLCRIDRSSSYSRRISATCVLLVWRNDIKCKYVFMFSLKNLARKGLKPPKFVVNSVPLYGPALVGAKTSAVRVMTECGSQIMCTGLTLEWLTHWGPRQNGRHFADNIFKCILLNENVEFRLRFQWSLFQRV